MLNSSAKVHASHSQISVDDFRKAGWSQHNWQKAIRPELPKCTSLTRLVLKSCDFPAGPKCISFSTLVLKKHKAGAARAYWFTTLVLKSCHVRGGAATCAQIISNDRATTKSDIYVKTTLPRRTDFDGNSCGCLGRESSTSRLLRLRCCIKLVAMVMAQWRLTAPEACMADFQEIRVQDAARLGRDRSTASQSFPLAVPLVYPSLSDLLQSFKGLDQLCFVEAWAVTIAFGARRQLNVPATCQPVLTGMVVHNWV